MKQLIKIYSAVLILLVGITSCEKDNVDVNAPANNATAASSVLSLNNRVLSAFIINENSIPTLPTGALPAAGTYNKFRRLLTYDTTANANKAPIYNVGDVLTIVGYMKGDDSAIAKRRINFRFFQPPTTFVTPTALSPVQRAEDSYRGFAPAAADILNTVSSTSISTSLTAPFNVKLVASESTGGIVNNTYLITLTYTIPAALSGRLISVNLTANTAGAAGDLGNVNWNYAFRVR